ncbi:MAG TPA: class II aldolase/adducin family protein, partial [Acidimicrobiales bacterium]
RGAPMDSSDVRWRIAAARRLLYRHGCDSGVGGQVSVRDEQGRGFWVSPFEFFDETVPESVMLLGFDLEVLEGAGPASPAVQFHASIYQGRPDVNAVIHTHSRYAIVLSSLGQPLGMYHAAATLFAGRQAIYRDTGELPSVYGPAVVEALGDKRVLIAQNHGIIVASDSLEHATVEAITFEEQARIHLACEAAGGSEMDPAEVRQAQADYDRYYRQATWDAILRRLRHSDPDLFEPALA